MFDSLIDRGYQFAFLSHAKTILGVDFRVAVDEVEGALGATAIPIEEIIAGGGGEAKGTQRLRKALTEKRWDKTTFVVEKRVNGVPRESQSHEVDHVRKFENGSRIALEIEWNNKDPFFDRDLENFKRLHADGAISIGIIVTRGSALQGNMRNLEDRVRRGVGNPCPLVLIGLPDSIVTFHEGKAALVEVEADEGKDQDTSAA